MPLDFREIFVGEKLFGFEFRDRGTLYFFGARDITEIDLQNRYSPLKFCALKQVHGTDLVSASMDRAEADAHWTTSPNLALRISTADCLPVLISHPDYICAIHAGWRGVHDGIIPKSLNELNARFGKGDEAVVAVGPHILTNSFEVDEELGLQIQSRAQSTYGCEKILVASEIAGKVHVDLLAIAMAQLRLGGIDSSRVYCLKLDTKTDERLHSFRREKFGEKSGEKTRVGRNYSFIARL